MISNSLIWDQHSVILLPGKEAKLNKMEKELWSNVFLNSYRGFTHSGECWLHFGIIQSEELGLWFLLCQFGNCVGSPADMWAKQWMIETDTWLYALSWQILLANVLLSSRSQPIFPYALPLLWGQTYLRKLSLLIAGSIWVLQMCFSIARSEGWRLAEWQEWTNSGVSFLSEASFLVQGTIERSQKRLLNQQTRFWKIPSQSKLGCRRKM